MAQSLEIGPFCLGNMTVERYILQPVIFDMSLQTPVLIPFARIPRAFYRPASSWFFCAQPQPGSALP